MRLIPRSPLACSTLYRSLYKSFIHEILWHSTHRFAGCTARARSSSSLSNVRRCSRRQIEARERAHGRAPLVLPSSRGSRSLFRDPRRARTQTHIIYICTPSICIHVYIAPMEQTPRRTTRTPVRCLRVSRHRVTDHPSGAINL